MKGHGNLIPTRAWLLPSRRSAFTRYGTAVLLISVATLLRWWLESYLDPLYFISYFPAVMIAGWFGGFWPGVLATVLSCLTASYLFIPPRFTLAMGRMELLQLLFFSACGVMLSGLNALLHLALRREEAAREQSHVTLASIGDAVIATDADGTVTFINPVGAALTGWSASQAVGQPLGTVFRILNEETRQPVSNPVVEVFKRGVVVGLANHTLLIARDGREFPIQDSAAPIKDSAGQVLGAVLVFYDVSERRKAELALVQREERLSIAATAAQLGIFEWSILADRALWENERMFEIFGRSRTDGPANRMEFVTNILHPDDRAAFQAALEDAIKAGGLFRNVCRIRRQKDGAVRTIELTGRTDLNTAGQAVRMVGVVADITERMQADRAVRQSQEQLQLIADTAPVLIAQCDQEHRYKFVNKPYAARFGLTPGEVVGRNISEILGEEAYGKVRSYVDRTLRGESVEFDLEMPYAALGTRHMHCAYAPETDSSGSVCGLIAVILDITDRKRAEQALLQAQKKLELHAANLEQTVLERTAALRENVAQLEEFSYTVSHDLRAPLRAMQGYATAIFEDYGDKLDPPAKDFLRQIMNAGQRMDRLTRELLDYSRLARAQVKLEPVQLERLIRDILSQYPNLQVADAEITLEPPWFAVLGNEALLTQALSNLLGNAIKFVAPGTRPKVRVWSERRGTRVRVWIEDNGIGVGRESQERIFGLFEQVFPRGQYEGTGIGLALVRKAIERLGGTVGVESDGTHGSRFWIEVKAA